MAIPRCETPEADGDRVFDLSQPTRGSTGGACRSASTSLAAFVSVSAVSPRPKVLASDISTKQWTCISQLPPRRVVSPLPPPSLVLDGRRQSEGLRSNPQVSRADRRCVQCSRRSREEKHRCFVQALPVSCHETRGKGKVEVFKNIPPERERKGEQSRVRGAPMNSCWDVGKILKSYDERRETRLKFLDRVQERCGCAVGRMLLSSAAVAVFLRSDRRTSTCHVSFQDGASSLASISP